MENFRSIANTKYVITRVFSENKTTAMLIEERLLQEKNKLISVNEINGALYNKSNGRSARSGD